MPRNGNRPGRETGENGRKASDHTTSENAIATLASPAGQFLQNVVGLGVRTLQRLVAIAAFIGAVWILARILENGYEPMLAAQLGGAYPFIAPIMPGVWITLSTAMIAILLWRVL